MRPLLSIIVPTKERYDYLEKLIHLILSFESREFELIVQDNTRDNSRIISFFNSIKDDRLRYFHDPTPLTSVQNFDKAVLNTQGKYVIFIGDDDFLLRNVCDVVKFMENNAIDAVKFRRANYYWADGERKKSLLTTGLFSKNITLLSPVKSLKKVLSNGCQEIDILPSLYYGIVKKDVLDQVYKIGHTYFPGNSADIANGVALSFFIKRYAYIKLPIVVPGTSCKTGGGTYAKKNRVLPLEEVHFVSKERLSTWDNSLPKIWHGSLVWPESAISALKYVGKMEFVSFLNYKAIWLAYSSISKEFFQDAKNRYGVAFLFYFAKIRLLVVRIIRSILNKLILICSAEYKINGHIYRNVGDVCDAENLLYHKIKKYCNKINVDIF